MCSFFLALTAIVVNASGSLILWFRGFLNSLEVVTSFESVVNSTCSIYCPDPSLFSPQSGRYSVQPGSNVIDRHVVSDIAPLANGTVPTGLTKTQLRNRRKRRAFKAYKDIERAERLSSFAKEFPGVDSSFAYEYSASPNIFKGAVAS